MTDAGEGHKAPTRRLYALVVGQAVQHLRSSRGPRGPQEKMSLGALARLAGLSKATVSRIERGQLMPRLSSSRAIALALGMSTADFLEIAEAAHARGFLLVQDGIPELEAARIAVAAMLSPGDAGDIGESGARRRFEAAIALLQGIDPAYELYVASDTLHLIAGSSHDQHGNPRREHILASASGIRISGGDW